MINPTKIHVIVNGQRVEKRPGQCRHRGDAFEWIDCPSCGGSVKAKVYPCTVKGRATDFTKPIPSVQQCIGCTSFTSR